MKYLSFRNLLVLSSGVLSGLLLIFGSYYAVSTGGEAYISYYFFLYVMVNIFTNNYLKKRIQFKSSMGYLILNFRIRILLSVLLIPVFTYNHGLLAILLLSLNTALPDAILRTAYPSYTKRVYGDKELQTVNSDYSLFRQLGYIIGAALAGFFIELSSILVLMLLIILSIASIFFLKKMPEDTIEIEQKDRGELNAKQKTIWEYLLSENKLNLYFSVFLILLVGFLLPVSLSPFIVEHLKLGSWELGLTETFFSIGALIGAYIYRKEKKLWLAPLMIMVASFIIPLVYFTNFKNIIVIMFLLGILLQSSIALFTQLQVSISKNRFGEVVASLYLNATICSAIYMATTSLISGILIEKSYYLISFLCLVSLLSYIIHVHKEKKAGLYGV